MSDSRNVGVQTEPVRGGLPVTSNRYVRAVSVITAYVAVVAFSGSVFGTPISGDEPVIRYVLVGMWWALPLFVYVSLERSHSAYVISAVYLIVSVLSIKHILGAEDEQAEGLGYAFMPIYLTVALVVIAAVTKVMRRAERFETRPRSHRGR